MTMYTSDSAEYLDWNFGGADCSPRFECIIAHTYIGGVWVYSNSDAIRFHASIHEQFVGVMHESTEHEKTWAEGDGPGCIEDGTARKGDLVCDALFDDFTEALDWLMGESKRLTADVFGGLGPSELAV